MSENPENAQNPDHDRTHTVGDTDRLRETFAETLAAVAEAGRAGMRPTPLAEIGALRRRRRAHRATLIASLAAATTCAVAVGVTLAVSPAAKTRLPPGGPTPTVGVGSPSTPPPAANPQTTLNTPGVANGSATSGPATPTSPASPAGTPSGPPASTTPAKLPPDIPARFLPVQKLPQSSAFEWLMEYVTAVHSEKPLPTICDNSLGTEVTNGVEQVRYTSPIGPEKIIETIYTYDTAAHAADRMTKITPACGGTGLSVRTSDGFGWAEPIIPTVTDHMIVARHGRWIATLEYNQETGWRAYNPAGDADVLKTMVERLHYAAIPDATFLTLNQVPFPDAGPWQGPSGVQPDQSPPVQDVCASAWDPVDTASKPGHPAPDTARMLYGQGDGTNIDPASEDVHLFASSGDAALAYQKAKSLYAAQTCRITEDTVGAVSATITPGGNLTAGGAQGFATGRSDDYPTAPPTGTFNHFRTYVVLKGNMIAVLTVPVTKEQVTDSSGDRSTLTTIASRLP